MERIYEVRHASEVDLDVLQGIERAASVLFPAGRLPDPDDVMPMAELQQAVLDRLLLVASLGERVVGFALSKEDGAYLHLAVVAVHPDHGRRGLGAELVRAVIEQAKRRRLKGVTLTTFGDLPWNAPFYARLGFRRATDAALTPLLRATLEKEKALGMRDRVAMLYSDAAGPRIGPASSV